MAQFHQGVTRQESEAPSARAPEQSSPAGLKRRTVLGAAAGAALLGPVAGAVGAPSAQATRRGPTRIAAGTDFSVRVSPDGKTFALDLLGVLWTVSAGGGGARRLTSDLYDIAQPDWSPDGKTLVFQSYRDGVFNLWTVRPDGSKLRQLTQGPFDHREPRWSPDGQSIVFASDRGGSYGIHTYDVRSAAIAALSDGAEDEYEPTWSADGSRVAFVVDNTRIDVIDVASGARSTHVTVPAGQIIHQPEWLPDGSDIAFHLLVEGRNEIHTAAGPLVTGEEAFPFRASFAEGGRWYYTSGGKIRTRTLGSTAVGTIGFSAAVSVVTPRYTKRRRDFESRRPQQVIGVGSPVLSPDGKQVVFRALNDIYLLDIGGKATPVFEDSWWKCDPDFSPDGTKLAYATDRTGTLNLWVRDLASGTDTQITHFTESAAVSCRWSPDGQLLAFLDQDGGLHTVDVETGDTQQIFAATFEPGRPTWSPDGNTIALAAVKPYSRRFREGLSKILLVNRTTGEATYVDPAPDRSLQTRGDDGPVWSPDGRNLVFAMESVLWVMPVSADGKPTGKARQITNEVSDAPSWSGDSRTVLYLNNGRLRLVDIGGRKAGRPRTVRLPLTWTNHTGTDSLVIHAGRMWDGVSERVRTDVDILISGHRITAIEPHREGRRGTVVDASDKFVMPGLVDIHHHREMQGYAYGSRQGPLWLAMGITTTRSPGSPAYHMVEERESVQSGKRIAPRYYGTGEAVDGRRIYYNFMRPTFSTKQLRLELDRAGALNYDLMKCYVRLPVEWHKQVIDWSHRKGVPVTSHYHYPAMAFGGDGTEHIGATNRFGYSRTITNVGSAYSDVIDMFNESKMARTPTLFTSSSLYAQDTSLVEDARVKRMYPLWRQVALANSVATANGPTGPITMANLENQVNQVAAMVRGGGLVTCGTDAPIDHIAISQHMNLRAMVRFGLTPREALITATKNAGDYLGERLGRIAKGYLADLAIIDGDPLSRIEDAANVSSVVASGVHHTVEDLLAPYSGPTSTEQTASPAPDTGSSGSSVGSPAAASGRGVAAGQARRAGRVLPAVPQHPSTSEFWWNAPAVLKAARGSCCHEG